MFSKCHEQLRLGGWQGEEEGFGEEEEREMRRGFEERVEEERGLKRGKRRRED